MPHNIFTFTETYSVQIARKQKNEKNYKINDESQITATSSYPAIKPRFIEFYTFY